MNTSIIKVFQIYDNSRALRACEIITSVFHHHHSSHKDESKWNEEMAIAADRLIYITLQWLARKGSVASVFLTHRQGESAAKWVRRVIRKKKDCKNKGDDATTHSMYLLYSNWLGDLSKNILTSRIINRREDGYTEINDISSTREFLNQFDGAG